LINMTKSILKINNYLFLGKSKIHSKGVFASAKIPNGKKVLEYRGELISKKEGTKRENKSLQL